jgi:hypothetical protein
MTRISLKRRNSATNEPPPVTPLDGSEMELEAGSWLIVD